MQRAMLEFAARHGAETLAERFGAAREFLQSPARSGAAYFAHNPVAQEQLDGLWDLNDAYLVHEFASENWVALHHVDVVRDMAAAKLSFAGLSTLANNFPLFSIPRMSPRSTSRPRIRRCMRDDPRFRGEHAVPARHLRPRRAPPGADGAGRRLPRAARGPAPSAHRIVPSRHACRSVRSDLDRTICEPILAELAKRTPQRGGTCGIA